MMRKVLSVATVAEDGSIRYGQSAVQKALGAAADDFQENQDLMGQVSSFCRKASQIVADLIRVRAAPDWQARSAMLAKIMAGQGKSQLKYADMLKVLVQVVDPKDVSGEMTYQTEKK
jgi:hypothetical protein